MIRRLPDEVREVENPPFPAVAYENYDGRLIVEIDKALARRDRTAAITAAVRPFQIGLPALLPAPLVAGWEQVKDGVGRNSGKALAAAGGTLIAAAAVVLAAAAFNGAQLLQPVNGVRAAPTAGVSASATQTVSRAPLGIPFVAPSGETSRPAVTATPSRPDRPSSRPSPSRTQQPSTPPAAGADQIAPLPMAPLQSGTPEAKPQPRASQAPERRERPRRVEERPDRPRKPDRPLETVQVPPTPEYEPTQEPTPEADPEVTDQETPKAQPEETEQVDCDGIVHVDIDPLLDLCVLD